jgi:hypothetical protein
MIGGEIEIRSLVTVLEGFARRFYEFLQTGDDERSHAGRDHFLQIIGRLVAGGTLARSSLASAVYSREASFSLLIR